MQLVENNEVFPPRQHYVDVDPKFLEFVKISKGLQKELEKRELWTEELKNKIIKNCGAIKDIPEIPADLKVQYFSLQTISRCRVLPAQYYYQHNIHFEFKRRFEPGENQYFPNGGFEVYGPEGSVHNYELDQVIVHPFQLGLVNFFSEAKNVVKDKVVDPDAPKRGRGRPSIPEHLRKTKAYVPTGGKRGRKPLPLEEKLKREAEREAKKSKSGGKRGRPRKQQ